MTLTSDEAYYCIEAIVYRGRCCDGHSFSCLYDPRDRIVWESRQDYVRRIGVSIPFIIEHQRASLATNWRIVRRHGFAAAWTVDGLWMDCNTGALIEAA
jgi:hypothetical protein